MPKIADVFRVLAGFGKGIARSRMSLIGAMIVTIVFPFLLGAILVDIFLHIKNPYFGAVIYMVLGPAFIGGLVMVFLGLFFFKGKEEVRLFTLEYMRGHFTDEVGFSRLRKIIFFGVFLTCVNLFIFGLLGYQGYHYMESTAFCGQFCHTVMNPEHTAYQNSPHSSVACVECHIGAGAGWFVKSKISGARQLAAVAFDTYPRPIQVPVHGLRPARDTCEECHRPEKFTGDKLVVKDKFLSDEANTHVQTVLMMKIGSAGDRTLSSNGVHWHIAPENKITYTASDHSRMTIPKVTLTKENGTEVVFNSGESEELLKEAGDHAEVREMDCIDCHNRPTHIYLSAEVALDNKILSGDIDKELPYVKKMALELVNRDYDSQEKARTTIAEELTRWYGEHYADLVAERPELLSKSIEGIQGAYSENVFPEMNIEWGTYRDHIGHQDDAGCFRCHDEEHEAESGDAISMDCDTCHTILAEEEEDPEILRALKGE